MPNRDHFIWIPKLCQFIFNDKFNLFMNHFSSFCFHQTFYEQNLKYLPPYTAVFFNKAVAKSNISIYVDVY